MDIETLKKANENLISTMNEAVKIQQDGRKKRQEAEAGAGKAGTGYPPLPSGRSIRNDFPAGNKLRMFDKSYHVAEHGEKPRGHIAGIQRRILAFFF